MINYSFIHQLLHEIFLGNKLIKKSIFELEKIIFLKKNNIKNNKHIFITGMPRSGTTALLNVLNKKTDLCSLKYKNMPFVMGPNISKFFKSKKLISDLNQIKEVKNFSFKMEKNGILNIYIYEVTPFMVWRFWVWYWDGTTC